MERVKKFLKKLSVTKQDEIDEILFKIELGETGHLDIKKLKGYKNLFRVRIGDVRIVFSQDKEKIKMLFIGTRGNSKYNQF